MSGTSRSLQTSNFSGLRVSRTYFTPEYSKNGANINAKLMISAFCNIASRANNGEGKRFPLQFTTWGKLAHVCAKSMSPGKEFNAFECKIDVYQGRVNKPGAAPGQPWIPALADDGTQLMTERVGFTIGLLTFGDDSNKHIANEIQENVRPMGWNVIGSQEEAQWKELLKVRQTIQFNPQLPTYGYARVHLPNGAGIAAYVQQPAPGVVGNAIDPAAAIAATLAGMNPAGVVTPEPVSVPVAVQPIAQPAAVVAPGGFVVPGV